MGKYKVLTEDQVQSFFEKGYLIVKNCVDLSISNPWIDQAYQRLGYDKNNPATWERGLVHMDHCNQVPVRQLAPKAWDAMMDVIGGEDRLETTVMHIESSHFSAINSWSWSDAFIVNFNRGADQPWQPPSAEVSGWHKDGSYFRHFLDSREQALLPIVMWSDMRHQGGATFIAPDSVRLIARFLADHPEGVPPGDFKFQDIIRQCKQFEEVTGEAGDMVIIHPFMLHASSQNVTGVPRFMSNPPVVLKEPMNLNRANPEDFSLLERATLHYLGVDRLDFRPMAPRDSYWWPEGSTPPVK
ncbi:MAG: phytanoyl-CoA dioxygenase family protein [Chloroflexi bacterium]|nr:phytanoyl-CoA dioxygenase family protein [Chloroflexota bacterium]